MDPNSQLSKDQCPKTAEEKERMVKVPYREAVGSLNWVAVVTWPDIAFVARTLTQFMENLGEAHWEACKCVFHHLQGTKDWRLTYGGGNEKGLVGYTDADGMSQEHRRAISGYAFLIDGGAVSWSSKKQEIATLSMTEAEYVAMTHAAKEAIWIRHLLGDVFHPLNDPITPSLRQSIVDRFSPFQRSIPCSNQTYDIRYHFICYAIENNSIQLYYCPTENMIVDTLTKALTTPKVKQFAFALGLRSD
jgi:hypothetical protein